MAPALGFAWRLAALGGLAVGLALSPMLGGPARGPELAIAAAVAAALLSATAPRGRAGSALGARAWVGLVAAAALAAGLGIGSLRVAAIDAGALRLAPGGGIEVGGFVTAVPRRARGMVRARVATPAGRLLVEAPEPVADLDIGAAVSAAGRLRAPAEFERGYLERLGIARVLSARSIELRDGARTGLTGALDRVRERAQGALSAGTPDRSAALLRGFVLGQDDRIDAATVDEFKRSGLAHLLAVSGQNVVLLAILATALLGALGVGLRARLVCILGLIGLYVLVTGAGPSIQRAGLMGAAGLIAALAGRPSSRWYALGLAAAATLAIDPRAAGDVGWQLSFVAVLGILLGTAPLSRALAGTAPGRARRALAEAAAMTTAATAATAPLMSFHFGTVSLVSLPANLVAVPAEAPVMWLGMLAAAAGQVEWLPVEPITWLAGLLAAYIAQVADWFAAPGWAQVELGLGGPAGLFGAYAALGTALALAVRSLGRRAALAPGRRAARVAGAVAGFVLAAAALAGLAGAERPGFPAPGLEMRMLDVGQGDAILLRPAGGEPVLVDAGPPGSGVAERLDELGIDSLAALAITHPDLDHSGGAPEVLASARVARLLVARADRALLGAAAASGARVRRIAAGASFRTGGLRVAVLWPRPGAGAAEPNASSLVLLARWRGFRILLSGDAEAELAPVHPGDVDVLKVAHHGSEDAGLVRLLSEAEPELALISVGADNPYGHPSPATLDALAEAGVPVLRTDTGGELVLTAGRRSWMIGDRGGG